MRWATGIRDAAEATYMLWLINHRVNAHLFDLDKDLSFRLLASCGLHRALRHEWLRGTATNRSTANVACRLLAEQHPTASDAIALATPNPSAVSTHPFQGQVPRYSAIP